MREWMVTRPTKLRNGERYTSVLQGISQILIAPEIDGQRLCMVEVTPTGEDHLITGRRPIIFAIRTRL